MHDWQYIAKEHDPHVWSVAYRVLQDPEDAADCHQDVFVDAMRRTEGKTIEDWGAFLRWLTVRRAIDRLRGRQRQNEKMDTDQSVDAVGVASTPSSEAEWNELLDIVREELTNIPAIQAQVFWLHCVENVSLNDIAKQLNLSANRTRVLLYRSRKKLRKVLEQNHPSLIERQKS